MSETSNDRAMAEVLALEALVVGFFHGLMKADPQNIGLVKYAFDYAEHVSELGSYKFGSEAAGPYLASVAEILEQLRAATIPDHGEPKGAV